MLLSYKTSQWSNQAKKMLHVKTFFFHSQNSMMVNFKILCHFDDSDPNNPINISMDSWRESFQLKISSASS